MFPERTQEFPETSSLSDQGGETAKSLPACKAVSSAILGQSHMGVLKMVLEVPHERFGNEAPR